MNLRHWMLPIALVMALSACGGDAATDEHGHAEGGEAGQTGQNSSDPCVRPSPQPRPTARGPAPDEFRRRSGYFSGITATTSISTRMPDSWDPTVVRTGYGSVKNSP